MADYNATPARRGRGRPRGRPPMVPPMPPTPPGVRRGSPMEPATPERSPARTPQRTTVRIGTRTPSTASVKSNHSPTMGPVVNDVATPYVEQPSARFEQFRENVARSPTYRMLARLRQTPVAQLNAALLRNAQYQDARAREERYREAREGSVVSRGTTYDGEDLSFIPSRSSSPSDIDTARNRANITPNELKGALFSALQENDKYKKEERDTNRETKAQARRILTTEYKRGQMIKPPYVDEREAYRQHILSHSLFPNLYNERMVMTQLGSS